VGIGIEIFGIVKAEEKQGGLYTFGKQRSILVRSACRCLSPLKLHLIAEVREVRSLKLKVVYCCGTKTIVTLI